MILHHLNQKFSGGGPQTSPRNCDITNTVYNAKTNHVKCVFGWEKTYLWKVIVLKAVSMD